MKKNYHTPKISYLQTLHSGSLMAANLSWAVNPSAPARIDFENAQMWN